MSDVPYLEPLLFWLRNDQALKGYFTDKSFFMPKHTLIEATEEAIKSDCPAPRALWILPADTTAINPRPGCKPNGLHTFHIVVYVQCIRDAFQIVARGDEPRLDGQYMELSKIRKEVKRSVSDFEISNREHQVRRYLDIMWIKDQNLYPDENNFLTTAMEFQVKIF